MHHLTDKYRPLPFWSWNDELEPETLRAQVRAMHQAGLGGFFMHARGGLTTAYLSEKWMQCVSAALDEAAKCGIAGWLYDENGWPSGFGNGMVNGLGEKFQQKYLRYEVIEAENCHLANTLCFAATDGTYLGRTLPENFSGKLICFYSESNPYYVDNLNSEVVAEFLRTTHQYYIDHLPPALLPYLKGIFTDEPQLSREGFSWSDILPEKYMMRYHRDLFADLPALITDLPESQEIRVNYWKLVTGLFQESYIGQISQWCHQHNWLLTGHHLAEEKPLDQILANGSLMAQYPAYDIPGADHLCRIKPDLVVMIQLVSAALQAGKEAILTESFGLAGWNLNFHGMCWLYHQQLACGINLLCQHLSSYSLKGLRKRDYPGSYFIHQPWWGDYQLLNDHFAFAGALIGGGKAETALAVLHPLSTGWCNFKGDLRSDAMEYYNEQLTGLTNALAASFLEFHFVDESLFARNGRVDGKNWHAGKCTYQMILIPPMSNFSGEIAAALKQFAANGGKILLIRNHFEYGKFTIDGIPADDEMTAFFNTLPAADSIAEAVGLAGKIFPDRIHIMENGSPAKDFTGICRKIDEKFFNRSGRFYLIANGDYNHSHQVEIQLPASACQVEAISFDGSKFSPVIEAVRQGDFCHFPWSFNAGAGAMFFLPDAIASIDEPVSAADPFELPVIKDAGGNFRIKNISHGNLLLLDRCSYQVDKGGWIAADVSMIHGRMLKLGRNAALDIKFTFEIDSSFDLNTPLEVIVETPERFTFQLNNIPFTPQENGTLFDQAFHRITLPANFRHGENTLLLSTVFHESKATYATLKRAEKFETEYNRLTFESEIENIFLLGNFAIRHHGSVETLERNAQRFNGKFYLASPAPENMVDEKNITADGFPFFAGKITLEKELEISAEEVEKISILRLKLAGVNSCRVRINGNDAGFIPCVSGSLRVNGMLKAGKNRLALELTTSLRNMLGPHHLAEGESYKVTTLAFCKEANAVGWIPPEFADGYCMVNNGITLIELA